MPKKILMSMLTTLLLVGPAGAMNAPDQQSTGTEQASLASPAAPAPDFGAMGRFIGKTFVRHTSVLAISTIDNGATLVIGRVHFRYTPDGQLFVYNNPAVLDKLKASIAPDGSLHVQGEDWDNVFKYIYKPNEYGGFTELIERKSLAGINFLQSFEHDSYNDFMPHTEANVRSEAASKAYRDAEAAQSAIDARAARRESDRALANAFNVNIASLNASTAQQAQANAQRTAMLANINAQAEAQRQAQAMQAQRQAADQQRLQLEKSKRWVAEKEQAAAQYQQAIATAQAERANQRAEQQSDQQQRKNQAQAAARERTAQHQAQAQADAQSRVQDAQREARAQAQQRVYAQQREAAARKAEQVQAPRQLAAAGKSAPSQPAGTDLNCLTEGVCRKACPARNAAQPSIFQDCITACSRRSGCKVSYQ